ncbi:predicted protein [Histoplasma capsulatum var. duboisii H88]|uniref:Predicted protein n=1 Tax=Ajellomyces capsulatus (strain H88) TaxID=544711 RepID=F0UBA6_AJEC8|nr:predicted protein [Histoplasma capsulatum var. duboisii H88]
MATTDSTKAPYIEILELGDCEICTAHEIPRKGNRSRRKDKKKRQQNPNQLANLRALLDQANQAPREIFALRYLVPWKLGSWISDLFAAIGTAISLDALASVPQSVNISPQSNICNIPQIVSFEGVISLSIVTPFSYLIILQTRTNRCWISTPEPTATLKSDPKFPRKTMWSMAIILLASFALGLWEYQASQNLTSGIVYLPQERTFYDERRALNPRFREGAEIRLQSPSSSVTTRRHFHAAASIENALLPHAS